MFSRIVRLSLLLLISCGCANAAAPSKPFPERAPQILVAGLRARSVNLQNRSGALMFLGGPVAGLVQNSSSKNSRLPLCEGLNVNFPSFRPEKVFAEEIAKCLGAMERFKQSTIAVSGAVIELPIEQKYRAAEEKPFISDWVNRADWIRAGMKWRRAPLSFDYLSPEQKADPDLICVEFAFEKVVINQGHELQFMCAFRFVSPSKMVVMGRNVNELEFSIDILNIGSKEGGEQFETEFRRGCAALAKVCIEKAIK